MRRHDLIPCSLTLALVVAGCADSRRGASQAASPARVSSLAVGMGGETPTATTAAGVVGTGGAIVSQPAEVALVAEDGSTSTGPVSAASTAKRPGSAEAGKVELSKDAFVGFSAGVTVLDVTVTSDRAGGQLAVALQSDGVVRVLGLASERPVELNAFPLSTTRSLEGLGRLTVGEQGHLLVTARDGVALFDPTQAQADVTWIDLSALTVRWPTGTPDSAGFEAGGRTLPVSGTSAALELQGQVFVTSTNPAAERGHLPGTLTALSPEKNAQPRIVATSGFQPTGLAALRTAAGPRLLVTNSGNAGTGASVDVVDPVTLERVATIPLPGDPWGPVLVTPDGTRGFVASERSPRVLVLDLASRTPAYMGRLELPSSSERNQISQLLLDPLGRLLAVNHYESALYLLSFAGSGATVQRVSGFARSGDPARMEGLLERVALRAAADGGVELLALTVELASGDQAAPGVTAALDAVRLPD